MYETQLVTSSHKVNETCLDIPETPDYLPIKAPLHFPLSRIFQEKDIANEIVTTDQTSRTFIYAHEEAVV